MKNSIIFFLFISLFACNQSSENYTKSDISKETGLESKTEEDKISDIKKKFEEINQNTASYETKSMEIIGESVEGGELKSYYQNEALKKVAVIYYGEMGKSIEEYYFSGNNVFFVFTQQYLYDKPMSAEGSKVKKIDENRYYFHNSKLIRWLNPNKVKVASSNFNQKESEILQKVKNLKKKLGSSKTGFLDELNDHLDMKSLFRLSPLTIFDGTTFGLDASQKDNLLKNGESADWKIKEETKTKLAIECKYPSSTVTLYFLKNKNNMDGILAAEVINERLTYLHLWKYLSIKNSLEHTNMLKKYSANDFVSEADKLPDSYKPPLHYLFIDDQTIEVSLDYYIGMDKEFGDREIINKIFLKWNGENFEEKIEKI